MRFKDIIEQGTIPPVGMTGNIGQLQDPRMAAATLVQQQQQKAAARNQIMKQIQDLQQQISALRRQQTQIR